MSGYEAHLTAAERTAWPLDATIRWDDIEPSIAATEYELLSALHDAALIEGYLPVFASRLMQLLWDDVDATAVLSLELYEGLRHYTALKRYLDSVGFTPAAVSAKQLVEARKRALDITYSDGDVIPLLTNFMCSELFAAFFFLRLCRETREPVLGELLTHIARDEFRHADAGADLLAARVQSDPSVVEGILRAAENFRHYGSDVVDVPVAEANDFEAIAAMNRKIREVCGISTTQHLQGALDERDL